MNETTFRILGLLEISGHGPLTAFGDEHGAILMLQAKNGIDGSGSHAARHQLVDTEKKTAVNYSPGPDYFLTIGMINRI